MNLSLLLMLAQVPAGTDLTRQFEKAVELQRKGDLHGAEAAYREVLRTAPRYAEAHANLGAVLIRLDRYEDAIQEYETALQLSPQLKPVLLNIGIAHFRRSAYARAVESLRRFLEVSPGHTQATQLMALALVELGRDEEALKYLELALSASPNDPALIYGLGLVSLRLRKPMVTGAINALAEIPGGHPASLLLRGQANLSNFQFEKAVGDLEEARRLNPELPRLHYSLGLAYFKTDRFDDARAAFESELKRAPKDVSSLCYLASMDEKEGRLESARRRLDVALSVEPASPDANWLLGKILIAQGRAAEAVRPLQVAVSGDPLDTQKRYQLARAYQQIGRKEEAERELAEMKRLQALEFEKDQSKVIKP